MEELAKKIEDTIHEILSHSNNNIEILIGKDEDGELTNTQRHILMMIKNGDITNKEIAIKLKVSNAAITKAIKGLILRGLISVRKDEKDGRVLRYKLSNSAKIIANKHEVNHDRTLNSYKRLLESYSEEERRIINSFLDNLVRTIRGRNEVY